MNKPINFPVPREVYYLSDWNKGTCGEDNPLDSIFVINNSRNMIKRGFVLDKVIPGCGLTHYCLTNPFHTILCSPRKILLENKAEQLGDSVYYVSGGKIEELYQLNRETTEKNLKYEKENFKTVYETHLAGLCSYIRKQELYQRPIKILVTYDSLRVLLSLLEVAKSSGALSQPMVHFNLVIDEFQTIFSDAAFKGDVELEFIELLDELIKQETVNSVLFASATPMLEKYLNQINLFNDTTFIRLDWVSNYNGRIKPPVVNVRHFNTFSNIKEAIEVEINKYRSGNFATKTILDPITNETKVCISKELVIYVNSVKEIISIILRSGLKPEEVNILCSNTTKNRNRIRSGLRKFKPNKYEIGKVPLKGEPHKMFTLCTSTVYLGADFYSTNARSIVISSLNYDCLTLDVRLDLPQILGRQRLTSENLFSDEIDIYYDTGTNQTPDEIREMIKHKTKITLGNIEDFNNKSPNSRVDYMEFFENGRGKNYEVSYVTLNSRLHKYPIARFNDLVKISEERAAEVLENDWANQYQVMNSTRLLGMKVGTVSLGNGGKVNPKKALGKVTREFVEKFNSIPKTRDKLKLLTTLDDPVYNVLKKEILNNVDKDLANLYSLLGTEGLKKCGFKKREAISLLSGSIPSSNDKLIRDEFYNHPELQVGMRVESKRAKEIIMGIYKKFNIDRKSTTSKELEEFFNIKISRETKVGDRSYYVDILSKKKN